MNDNLRIDGCGHRISQSLFCASPLQRQYLSISTLDPTRRALWVSAGSQCCLTPPWREHGTPLAPAPSCGAASQFLSEKMGACHARRLPPALVRAVRAYACLRDTSRGLQHAGGVTNLDACMSTDPRRLVGPREDTMMARNHELSCTCLEWRCQAVKVVGKPSMGFTNTQSPEISGRTKA